MKTIALVLFFFTLFSYAQKKETKQSIDSLILALPEMKEDTIKINVFNSLSENFKNSNFKSAHLYALKALELSEKLNWKDGKALSYRSIGLSYAAVSDYEKALLNYNEGIKVASKTKTKARILGNIAIVYSHQSNFTKALEYNNKSLKLFEEIDNKKGRIIILNNIAIIYLQLKQIDKFKEYNRKIKKISNNNIAELPIQKITAVLKKDSATAVVKPNSNTDITHSYAAILSKDLFSGNQNNNKEAELLFKNSVIYFSQKKYDEALKTAFKALYIWDKNENKNIYYRNCRFIGEIYLEKAKKESDKKIRNEYTELSLKYLKTAVNPFLESNYLIGIYDTYNTIAEVENFRGNFKAAFENNKKASFYKDAVYNSKNKETIKNLEDKREIELRDKQILIDSISLKSKEKQKAFLIAGMLLLGIIGSLLFYQNINRKKTNQKLQYLNANLDQANQTKNRLLSILNHDLRSPVNSFIHYIQFQKENPGILDIETRDRIENDTLSSAKNLLHSMEDILLWTKDQMENFNPVLKSTNIGLVFEVTKNHFSAEKNIAIVFENPDNMTLFTDENFLKTIIRNLTANAINAFQMGVSSSGVKATITWRAWESENHIYLSISDNGVGADLENFRALYFHYDSISSKSGLGLHLVRDLAKAIHCEIDVKSDQNVGTVFTLKFRDFKQDLNS